MTKTRTALVGLALGALLLAPQASDLASAAASAFAGNSQTQSISTASYLAAPVSSTAASNPKQALQIQPGNSTAAQYFYVKSFGTDSLTGFTFSGTTTSGSLTYKKCPIGTTFSSSTRCSDSSTPTTVTAGAVTAALGTSSYQPMSVTPSKTNVTITITVTINNTQDRAAVTSIS